MQEHLVVQQPRRAILPAQRRRITKPPEDFLRKLRRLLQLERPVAGDGVWITRPHPDAEACPLVLGSLLMIDALNKSTPIEQLTYYLHLLSVRRNTFDADSNSIEQPAGRGPKLPCPRHEV